MLSLQAAAEHLERSKDRPAEECLICSDELAVVHTTQAQAQIDLDGVFANPATGAPQILSLPERLVAQASV
jgi:hypothetical protein